MDFLYSPYDQRESVHTDLLRFIRLKEVRMDGWISHIPLFPQFPLFHYSPYSIIPLFPSQPKGVRTKQSKSVWMDSPYSIIPHIPPIPLFFNYQFFVKDTRISYNFDEIYTGPVSRSIQ